MIEHVTCCAANNRKQNPKHRRIIIMSLSFSPRYVCRLQPHDAQPILTNIAISPSLSTTPSPDCNATVNNGGMNDGKTMNKTSHENLRHDPDARKLPILTFSNVDDHHQSVPYQTLFTSTQRRCWSHASTWRQEPPAAVVYIPLDF